MSLIEDHFKLHRPPFPQSADPAALLSHQNIKEALDRLRFAIDRDGIALLTAESGCGKSTLLASLARDLDATAYLIIYASLSTLGPFSLLASLAAKLGLRPKRFKGGTAQDLVTHLRGQHSAPSSSSTRRTSCPTPRSRTCACSPARASTRRAPSRWCSPGNRSCASASPSRSTTPSPSA